MAHAKPSDLQDIENLLEDLRKITALKEKSMGCFYHKSKSVLHFHTKGERRFAHVFDGTSWIEVDIKHSPSVTTQKQVFKKIQTLLL